MMTSLQVVDELFWNMQMLILRSLFAVRDVMINDRHCFELYGYDVMIDDALKPWLIEVNASPAMTANTREDYDMKSCVLNDVFDVIDREGKRRGDEVSIGGFDLIYDNEFVDMYGNGWSTGLGAKIEPGSEHRRRERHAASSPVPPKSARDSSNLRSAHGRGKHLRPRAGKT